MAGISSGAPAPITSRTRRNHGVFMLGSELASVYSSRKAGDARGVTLTVGAGGLVLTGNVTPGQARAIARALTAAAMAADCVQQGGAA